MMALLYHAQLFISTCFDYSNMSLLCSRPFHVFIVEDAYEERNMFIYETCLPCLFMPSFLLLLLSKVFSASLSCLRESPREVRPPCSRPVRRRHSAVVFRRVARYGILRRSATRQTGRLSLVAFAAVLPLTRTGVAGGWYAAYRVSVCRMLIDARPFGAP